MRRRGGVWAASIAAGLSLSLAGCVAPESPLVTTPPADEPVSETAPVPDNAVEQEVIADEVVFGSVDECLQGNWEINNDAFGDFFARTDDRVVSVNVSGLATMTVDGDTYRMFFEEWSIQYDTGEPTFLIARNGSETAQFAMTPDSAMAVVEQDDQITVELFSIVEGGDGEAIAIATNDPGPLPLDASTLQCSASTLEVFVEQESFLLDRL